MTERIVARGKIKVDARKAILKLRDHLLVDLHLYACEVARVAVALEAKTLDVAWDSDDVLLTFDGRGLPPAAIVRARDHVLSPETDVADGDALRVLGIGISAALGLDPRFVDVITADASGCSRVRFESKHIEEDGAADAPEVVAVPLPDGMPCPGMRVHVRKKVRLGDLGRLVRGDAPREVTLLAENARDAPLVVRFAGAPIARPPGPTVLLRVDLDEPSLTRGALEILWPSPGFTPQTFYLDLGVHLAVGPLVGLREGTASTLPVRLIVDSPKLPTNASRSEVRDSDVVQRVRARVPSALAAALATLEAIVVRGETPETPARGLLIGHSVTVLDPRRDVLEEVLGWIAADVARTTRAGGGVSAEETALLSLPLLRDAVGGPLSLAALRGGSPEHPLLVYTAAEPAPAALAPFLTGVVWRRGRAVEEAFAMLAQTSANEHVALAREGHARRARALEHPASRPELAASESYLLKQAFTVTVGPFAGLAGEVAIVRREAGYRRASTARIFVDDRLLEEVQLPGVALPLDMALAWPSVLRARLAYDGVERDESVTRAVLYALRVAAVAVGEQLGPRDPELARLAVFAFAGASRDLGDTSPALGSLGRLAHAAAWPTTDGKLTTLAALDTYARRTGALCVGPGDAGPAADGRPVLVSSHGKAVLELLGPKVVIVDLARVFARGADYVAAALDEAGREFSIKVPIERPHVKGFVAVGPNRRRILHGGRVMRDDPHVFRNGPVLVVFEDRAAVPNASHDDLLWWSVDAAGTAREEDALLALVLEGCERGELEHLPYSEYLATAERKIGERLGTGGNKAQYLALEAIHQRLEKLPAHIQGMKHARAKEAILARPLHASRSLPGGASVTTPSGVVSVAIRRGGARAVAAGEVLFAGHRACATAAYYPLDVLVDVTRETLLSAFAALTTEGETWAREQVFEATVKLLGDLATRDDFVSDVEALDLCAALLENEVHLTSRIARVLESARWPTVQGDTTRLGLAKTVAVGSVAYPSYRTGEQISPFDAPALHVPAGPLGNLRQRVLQGVGYTLTDVSKEIARLQATRARGVKTAPPRLPGEPLHPRLRASLAALGATLIEGEIEINEEPMVAVARVSDDGAASPCSFSLAHPIRAVFRAGEVPNDTLAAELTTATARHMRALALHLDELPAFVRDRVRAFVCDAIRTGDRHANDDDAGCFMDIRGYSWSIARLKEVSALRRTSDQGPWPASLEGHESAALVHVTDREAAALSSALRFQDVTKELRERLQGEARRAAPPSPALTLPPDIRAKCIYTATFDEDGARGELGLLKPAHAALRAIAVYTTMRHVGLIEDRDGWPTVAMIDVDGLATTRGFDGLAVKADVTRIQRRVRVAASVRASVMLAAPRDSLGVIRLPIPFLARLGGTPTPCLGVFWLEKTWPEAPTVHLESFDGVDPFRVPRVAPSGSAQHGVLPVSGQLFVCEGGQPLQAALGMVFQTVLERLSPIVAAASGAKRAAPEELAAYAWDLRLLGQRADEDPVKELAKEVVDEVLVRVAGKRIGKRKEKEEEEREPEEERSGTGTFTGAAASLAVEPSVRPDFFSGLVLRIVDLVAPAPPTPSESPLTNAILKGLLAMRLTGDPVESVGLATRGRPVRYEARTKMVVVNPTHPSIVALEGHPSRELLLLSAAVSEINRELVPVTDAEELKVIVDLLRDG